MLNDHVTRLQKLVLLLEKNENQHLFVPIVIEKTKLLISEVMNNNYNLSDTARFASGLERFISDDFSFCETEIGRSILDVYNSILSEAYQVYGSEW